MGSIKKTYAKIVSIKHKNIKLVYYLKSFLKLKYTSKNTQKKLNKILQSQSKYNPEYIQERVNYCNKLNEKITFSDNVKTLKDFVYSKEFQTYFFDAWWYTRLFDNNNKFSYQFGDITEIPKVPSIVKSRPINSNNINSVLLNLNKVRHFSFVKESKSFYKKKNMLMWRGNIWDYQPQRVDFFKKHFKNPICDIGHVNNYNNTDKWHTEKLTIHEQLNYKFILSIEGNDVATNLKWVMSSNSVAVMPTPKFETWFMEGTLIPDHHYIHIKDDYSDLNNKLEYYIQNPDKADKIRQNANKYVSQFKNKKREDLISVLVLKKYFEKTE
ncbi:lipopolysaccharide biosynthesis protein [Labilibacter sediminis]|nr:lipopolysaccharide biosynthesis protein [Labilibacter sediminis]